MNQQEYLKELKAHDWTYSYASGEAYRKGQDNHNRLTALADADENLKALYRAYSLFVWEGQEEPTVNEQPAASCQKPSAPKGKYNLSEIMRDAWRIAREGQRRFGGQLKPYFAESLRQAWAKAKAKSLSSIDCPPHQPQQVFYICIDVKTGHNTRIVNLPLIDEVFTSHRQAQIAVRILSGAFAKPFIKSSRHYRLH
jgi:hypothetical protein